MKKKNYHFVTVWQLLLILMSFLSFQPASAQVKYKLMRLHEPAVSVEQPVKLTKKKCDTQLAAPKAEAAYPGDEYLMRAYSAFDPQTGDNIFIEGGKLTTYPVYIQLDDNSGEAKITNLINMSSPSTITGIWDKDASTITVNTPSYWTDPYTECAIIGKDGDYDLFLQAGDMYGIGYWESYDALVMDVSSDRNTITLRQDFAASLLAYDDYFGYYDGGFSSIFFDGKMFKKGEGPNIIADRDNLDFGRCFVGGTVEKTIGIVNTGTEPADYVVDASGDGLTIENPSGNLGLGESATINIKFTPKEAKQFTGTITLSTDNGDKTINVVANVEAVPDYKKITSEGSDLVTYNTSLDYPWLLTDTIENQTVAITTNQGQGMTSSILYATVTVPQGKKVVASWDAVYDPRYANYDEFHVNCDDKEVAVYDEQGRQNVKGSVEIAPGSHTLSFNYLKDLMVNTGAVKYGKDYVYLRDLKYQIVDYKAADASISSNSLDMRRYFLDLDLVEDADSSITIKNEGSDSLIIKGIKNSTNFSATVAKNKLGEFESVPVKITFLARSVGTYQGDITLQTSAGDYTIHCKAVVETPYDYSKIVDEGDFLFISDRDIPFVVDGNTTHNGNDNPNDSIESYSSLGCFFTVPEGKTGVLRWEGTVDGTDDDYAMFTIDDALYAEVLEGDSVDGSYRIATPALTYLKPGMHYVVFAFCTNGDGKAKLTNRYTISHLKLQLFDNLDGVTIWEGETVNIPETYPGHYSTATVNVINLSSTQMELGDINGNGAFTGQSDPEGWNYAIQYGVVPIKVVFTPTATGEQNGDITIKTNNGDVVLKCNAKALDTSNLIYFDDFESMADWSILNNDGDYDQWQIYGGNTGKFSDLGEGILRFNSNFISEQADDYIVSPKITIPENGAKLTFLRSVRSANANTVSYSVKVGEGTDPSTYTTVFTEEEEPISYKPVTIDLKEFAGKNVHIAFYTDAQPQSGLLQIDNFTVTSGTSTGIDGIRSDAFGNGSVRYTIDGKKADNNSKGIIIEKSVDEDGHNVVRKQIIR